ncbi:bifunctional nuclease family protein [bacterium]|nr:bifunctional nuclease family protein [bacterium]QQR59305.1 MAG: bifunctional nuclease family protein [Candidatus Melainabacteria bacterium]
MIEMHVDTVVFDRKSGETVVVLSDQERKIALPVWVGITEAKAISLALNNTSSKRPLTHDLLLSVISQTGYKVSEVVVNELESNVFKAQITLTPAAQNQSPNDFRAPVKLDSRPSDAIAIAALLGLGVQVSPDVLAKANFLIGGQKEKEIQSEDFKNFVQSVKASDFKLPGFQGLIELPKDEGESEAK